LNQKSVLDSLDVPTDKKWEDCNTETGNAMAKFDSRMNAAPMLVDLLNNNVKVLLYHGELDFICNWVGGEKAIDGVEWYGQGEWMKTSGKWENIGYGLMRKWNSLSFVKFSNAGHMVPMDQPENALKMMDQFINA